MFAKGEICKFANQLHKINVNLQVFGKRGFYRLLLLCTPGYLPVSSIQLPLKTTPHVLVRNEWMSLLNIEPH